MPLFNFSLRPLYEVQPWGTAPDLSLSWFGLTDGCYWIDAGGEELFRYWDEALAKWPRDPFAGPYIDYQVIRLYEDLINILPHVLQPIPPPLRGYIRVAYHQPSWWDAFRGFWESDLSEIEEEVELAYLANDWVSRRTIDTLYLTCGPRIWIWRKADRVTITWDSTSGTVDGVKAWASERGAYSLAVDDFLAEVHSFQDRLMGQMAGRIKAIEAGWTRPEIRIDLQGLVQQHEYRRRIPETALKTRPDKIDAGAIEAAIRRIVGQP